MVFLLRVGAYLASAFVLWQFFQGGSAPLDYGRHLVLDPERGMIFGVCAGLAGYSGIDVSLIRLLWALAAFYRGAGIGIYILAFLIIPVAP